MPLVSEELCHDRATVRGMSRTRISTTVDTDNLARCRSLSGVPDSTMIDRALAALLRELEGARERAAIDAQPYEEDQEVSWEAPTGPDLPYDGAIPDSVMKLAAERRERYRA